MGDLNSKPFRTAIKRKYSKSKSLGAAADLDEKAMMLCSLWEAYLRESSWHPFKEVVAEDDEKLMELRREYGQEVFKAVTTALAEMNEYNGSGRYTVEELWNFVEDRKASLGEGLSDILNLWKPKKRRSRPSFRTENFPSSQAEKGKFLK